MRLGKAKAPMRAAWPLGAKPAATRDTDVIVVQIGDDGGRSSSR